MLFADLHLARRLELTNTLECVEYGRAYAKLFPESGAISVACMGGYATYAGTDSPITQAFGLGLQGEVSEAEVEALEEFYFSRRVPVYIELCPLADPSLLNSLMARGYRISETSNVLYQELNSFNTEPISRATVRIPTTSEAEMWARVITLGFMETEEPDPMLMKVAQTIFHTENSIPLLVEIEGQPAGVGGVFIHDQIA